MFIINGFDLNLGVVFIFEICFFFKYCIEVIDEEFLIIVIICSVNNYFKRFVNYNLYIVMNLC